MDEKTPEQAEPDSQIQLALMTIGHMFVEYRDDPIMRDLCRLAMKCAQERLIHG